MVELLGDVGRKLHTARSRNDQVSTDLRLWIRDAIEAIDSQLVNLQIAFLKQAEQGADPKWHFLYREIRLEEHRFLVGTLLGLGLISIRPVGLFHV